jgi:hypothetical protein
MTGTLSVSRRRRPTRLERLPDADPRGPAHYDAGHARRVLDSREAVREAEDAGRCRQTARRLTSRSGCARAMLVMQLQITMIERACTGVRAAAGEWAHITQVLSGRPAQHGFGGA